MTTQTVERRKFTYEDYRLLPENGHRYQVVEGDLVMSPSPKQKHQLIARRLVARLLKHIEGDDLGELFFAPFDVVLSRRDVFQPDILFVSRERRRIITEENVQGAPDLVIEILSEATQRLDKVAKRNVYERHGVKEYWIVSPEGETIEVLALRGKRYATAGLYGAAHTLTSPLLKGLRIPAAAIFA